MKRLIAGAVGLLVLSAGCATGNDDTPSGPTGPHDASAKIDAELIEVEPAAAEPGEILSVSFPEQTDRGVAFVLEEETADGWDLRYFLMAGSEPDDAGQWWTPDDTEGRAWPDVGVAGPGPDSLEVPGTAPPGDYRLCTGNAGENVCAPLEIVE